MVQQWGICLPMQEIPVRSLVQEDATCSRVTKPVCLCARAREPQLLTPRASTPEARVPCALQQENPLK